MLLGLPMLVEILVEQGQAAECTTRIRRMLRHMLLLLSKHAPRHPVCFKARMSGEGRLKMVRGLVQAVL